MKRNIKSLVYVGISTAIVLVCCQPTDKVQSMGDTTTAVDHVVANAPPAPGAQKMGDGIQTAMFIEKAALGNMFEVTSGKLAFEKANNKGVRAFGKLMVQDHKRIHEALTALSAAKGLKLPVSLSAKQMEQVRQMEKMETDYFEKLYLKMMNENHNKDIELFKGAGDSPDTAVSNFAGQFLPVLESHREKALNVREGIK